MFHHSRGIQDHCRARSPDSRPLSFGCLGQLLRLPSMLAGFAHGQGNSFCCFMWPSNSFQNRYFSYERRDGSFTPPKHIPYTNKTVTRGRKNFHQQRRQGKYQVKCLPSSHPQRSTGRKKKPWSGLSLPKPRADPSSHDFTVFEQTKSNSLWNCNWT